MQVDLRARSLVEALERFDTPPPERDVERIGKLRANAAGRSARRPACELVPLEKADVDSGFGQMERDAAPDDAASDDYDVGGNGDVAHRRTRFFRKNPRFAGRSASRRIR